MLASRSYQRLAVARAGLRADGSPPISPPLQHRSEHSPADDATHPDQVAPWRVCITATDLRQPFENSEGILGEAHWLFELQDSSGYHFVCLFSLALLTGDPQFRKECADRRRYQCYIHTASLLLRTTNIFCGWA